MTLPAGVALALSQLRARRTGIAIGVYPADETSSLELQRAPDAAGSPDTGSAETIAELPPDTRIFVDTLPLDAARRHYRLRATGLGGDPSDWTGWVDAVPGVLPAKLHRPDTVPLVMRARVLSASATQIVVRVAVADLFPQGAASVSISYLNEGTPGVTPASPQTVTPVPTLTEAAGTYVDFTITRPAFNAAPGRVTFTATATDRLTDSDAVDVPAQAASPAWLEVSHTVSSTAYLIYWTGSPTVQVKIDGAAWATPGASPISVARNASGGARKAYTFRAGPGSLGDYQSHPVTVDPQEATPPTTPAFTGGSEAGASAPGDGGGYLDVTFTHENFPAGWTVDVELTNVVGDPITATSATGTGYTASPARVNIALASGASGDVRLVGRDSGSAQIAELSFTFGPVP